MAQYQVVKDRQYMHKHNTEVHSRNHCWSGKAVSTTYSVFVSVTSVNQLARRMCCIVLSLVACLALHHIFQHHLRNSMIFE
jgi:hypothetical protein